MGKLAGACHSKSLITAGGPGEKGGSEKALEIKDGVKVTSFETSQKRYQRGERRGIVPGLAEELSVERDYSGQMRMIFEQWCKFAANKPANPGVGETPAQGGECGQGLNYVTQ